MKFYPNQRIVGEEDGPVSLAELSFNRLQSVALRSFSAYSSLLEEL